MLAELPAGPGATPAGIAVHCRVRRGYVAAVSVRPRRPDPVDRLAVGRTPVEAMRLFSSLFSLCPEAHGLAASRALASATGLAIPPEVQTIQETRRELEIIKEHALNLLLRQPSSRPELAPALLDVYAALRRALGKTCSYWPPDRPPAVDAIGLHSGLKLWDKILCTVCGDFWRMPEADLAALQRWQAGRDSPAACLLERHAQPDWADFGRCDGALLPSLPDERLDTWLADQPAEITTPVWEGTPRETGSYARQAETALLREVRGRFGNGLYARTLARVAEIRQLFLGIRSRFAADSVPVRSRPGGIGGAGLAQVEASRGRLIHRAEVVSGRIASYRIVAPTEWNFHPEGLLRQALTGAPATPALAEQAKAFLHAVDPCVDFHLAFDYA